MKPITEAVLNILTYYYIVIVLHLLVQLIAHHVCTLENVLHLQILHFLYLITLREYASHLFIWTLPKIYMISILSRIYIMLFRSSQLFDGMVKMGNNTR